MDVTDILPQLDRLDGEIDDLEEVLEPLLGSLPEVASKLPLLDKAKLYVLVTYALESMLFSSLRLGGVNAKEHPVFKELTRVRQYFEKIKTIENPPPPPAPPSTTLNREAAIRFIRADLADDKEVNTKLSEMIAKERAKAAIKAARMGVKRKADAEEPEAEAATKEKKDAGEDNKNPEEEEDDDEEEDESSKPKESKKSKKSKKKRRKSGKSKE